MEAQKKLSYSSRSNAKYALIYSGKYGNEIRTSNKHPWCRSDTSSEMSLKDVEYGVIDGILYIKGIQIYYCHIDNIFNVLTTWGDRTLCTINQKYNEKLLYPFIEEDIYIRRWWWKTKKIKGLNITNLNTTKWHLSKVETPCEITFNVFNLIEL